MRHLEHYCCSTPPPPIYAVTQAFAASYTVPIVQRGHPTVPRYVGRKTTVPERGVEGGGIVIVDDGAVDEVRGLMSAISK